MGLLVNFTVKFVTEVDEMDLRGLTPQAFIQEMYEEDPSDLFSNSEAVDLRIGAVTKGEDSDDAEGDEDDDLTILDDEEIRSTEE